MDSTAENIDALKSALAAMEQASQAEEGCEDFTFSVEVNNPNKLRITERWQSAEFLAAHFKAPHMATFQAAMREHPPTSSQAHFYEATEFTPG
jgi:quinol monooxygenase YgiN